MSRIEIPMEEYQGMKEKITSLETSLGKTKSEAELFKSKYAAIVEALDNASEAGLVTRIFKWKKLIKSLIE